MGSVGIPTLNHQNTKITAIEKVEIAELRTSLSRIEEVTSLEQIDEGRVPIKELSHSNFSTRKEFL